MSRFELNLAKFLILSIPIFLITGAFLADLALSTACILFLIYIVRKRQFNLFKDNYFIFFLLFYTIVLISCFQSDYLDKIFWKNIFYFRFGIFLLLVKHIIYNDEKFIKNLKNILLLIFILLFADSLFQFIVGKNILGFTHPSGRITSLFGDESVLGSYIVRFCPLLIALIFLTKGNKYEFFLILSLSFILSVISGERASIFLFLIFLSVLFLIWKYDVKKKLIFLFTFIIFITISFTIIINTSESAKFRLIDKTLSQININYKNNKPFYKEFKINGENSALARNDTLLPLQYTLYFEASKKYFSII